MYSALAAAFIEANPKHQGGAQADVTRIVIHGTVSPTKTGGARANARYFQSATAGGAAHYCVDIGEIIACVSEDTVAHHAPPNTGSIGIELCDPQTGDGARWADPDHIAMLGLAAELVRDIATRWHVPLIWLSASNLLAGDRGITSHANVSAAWHRTDHTDPGPDFPVDGFMQLVQGGSSPLPQPRRHKVIRLIKAKGKPAVYATDLVTKRWVHDETQLAHIKPVITADGGIGEVQEWDPADVDAIPTIGPTP